MEQLMLARNCRLSERRGAAVTAEQCNVFPLQKGDFSCPVLGNISSSGPDWPPEPPSQGRAWSPPHLVPGCRASLAQASSWSHPSGIGIRAQGGFPLAGCIQDGRAIIQGCLNWLGPQSLFVHTISLLPPVFGITNTLILD